MLKFSAITIAVAMALAAVPSSQHSAYASAVSSPSARPAARSTVTATQRRHTHDLAADQAAVTQGTIAAKGDGVTVTEAIVVQGYALTTYRVDDDNDTGQCLFAYSYGGTWAVKTCSAGFFSVSNIQTYGYTTPYWIAYTLASSSPQTWASEQTQDRMNGQPLPIAPSCTPDSYGYCVVSVTNVSSSVCGWPVDGGQSFTIYNDQYPGNLSAYTWSYVDDGNCNPAAMWQGPSAYDATLDPAMPGGGQDQSGAPRG